jgi:hypothetical protein
LRLRLTLALLAFLPAPCATGWIYSEHRAIMTKGIETLDPRQQAALEGIWAAAREGYAERLCAAPAAGDQGDRPTCIDLAAWPAIGGDHSCAPELRTILETDWILKVAAIAEKTGRKIRAARNEAERRNAQMNGDLGLERADPEYSTRAGANNAHFPLPRSSSEPKDYVVDTLRPGAEPNAIAIYVLFHVAALHAAGRLDGNSLSPEQRAVEARRVLALEAFAVHFLQDSFASGHIAGSWGNAAERKGTHDYYDEHGLETESWDHQPMLLFGDGHMTETDLERAGQVVRASLVQVLDALAPDAAVRKDAAGVRVPEEVFDLSLDVCQATRMPDWEVPPAMAPYLAEVLRPTPMPFRGPGYAALPRFRAEIGPFVGLASGVSVSGAGGGFIEGASGGAQGSLDVGLRLGLGLDALLGDSGDGLIFLQAGLVSQTQATGSCGSGCPADPILEQFVPSVPARSGLSLRLRLPYWLIPGDLVLAAPFLLFTDPKALEKMAITAADGGLIPWQTKLSTPIGAVQFVIGREVGATLFGFGTPDAFLTLVPTPEGTAIEALALKSLQWDFPILEYRPFREYGTRYTFATFLQLGAGFDVPISVEVVGSPGTPPPSLQTRVFGYIRLFFDGRRYF